MPAPIARAWRRSERRRAFAARRASPQRDRAPSVMAATFARRFRPGDEIVDMVEDIACVAAEGGAFAAPSHPLEHARGQAEIMAGLGGVEEGIAAARAFGARDVVVAHRELRRSEEHTSELQSLMRNSYA